MNLDNDKFEFPLNSEDNNNSSNNDTEKSPVERFVRNLINKKEISLARSILSTLGEEYNHLLFELEVQAGNYKKAMEIFNSLPKNKQQLYLHLADTIENDADKISEALESMVKNFQFENFPIFSAEAQRLKKEYPQVIENVALQLLAALKRNDKQKIKNLSELLEQLDSSHPVLLQVKRKVDSKNILGPAILLALLSFVIANLFISIWSITLSKPVSVSGISKKLDEIGKSIEVMLNNFNENNDNLTQINKNIQDVKSKIELMQSIITELENTKNNATDSNVVTSKQQIDENLIQNLYKESQNLSKIVSGLDKQITVLNNKLAELVSENFSSVQSNSKQEKTISSTNYKEEDLQKVLNDLSSVKSDLKLINSKISELKSAINNPTDNINKNIKALDTKIEKVMNSIKETDEKFEKLYVVISQINNVEKLNKLSSTVEIINQELTELSQGSKERYPKIDKGLEQIKEIFSSSQELLKQVSEIKRLISENVQDIQSSQTNQNQKIESTQESKNFEILSSLEKQISDLGKQLLELKNTTSVLIKEVIEIKNSIVTTESKNNLSVSSVSQVDKLISETKDIYELYSAGLGFYSNKKFQEAIKIFTYVEDKLEGIEVHFKEDNYYYLILSYINISDTSNAKKKFEEYKKLYPNGRYINELSRFF